MGNTVYCLVHSEPEASAILTHLRNSGFGTEISVLLQDRSDTKNISLKEDAARGAGIGSILGALVALTVPGVGAVFAIGPIVAAFGGAVAGGAVGGLLGGAGALKPLGLPDEVAKRLHHRISEGDILISVESEDPAKLRTAIRIVQSEGASEIFDNSPKAA